MSARPGIAGSAGDEPVAMTKRRAAMVKSPAATVRASKNRAVPSMIRTPRPARRCRVSLGATVPATSRRWAFTAAKSTPKRAALSPKCAALRMILARSAVTASAAAGTLPPLPAPPPRAPFSISTTGTPKAAAADAAARPAAPAPMTQMSGLSSCLSSCVIGLTHPRDSSIARNAALRENDTAQGLSGLPRGLAGHIDGPGGLSYKPRQSRADHIHAAIACGEPGAVGDQSRETDLPAEQIGAQTPSRLSRPDGDQGRPQGAGGPAGARPQAAQCVIAYSLPLPCLPQPWSG